LLLVIDAESKHCPDCA